MYVYDKRVNDLEWLSMTFRNPVISDGSIHDEIVYCPQLNVYHTQIMIFPDHYTLEVILDGPFWVKKFD